MHPFLLGIVGVEGRFFKEGRPCGALVSQVFDKSKIKYSMQWGCEPPTQHIGEAGENVIDVIGKESIRRGSF
jgi:hypothetical protein